MKKNAFLVLNNIPEAAALTIVVGAIFLLFTYTATWAQPEYYLRWLPNAVSNGTHLTFMDWFRGVDSVSYDGAVRPRFISYSLTVLNAKFRLWLYNYFVPFPNLSLALLISVVFTPFLYFKFSKILLGNRTAAFFATCLHLTSVGFFSSTSFQYHQGKTLVQPVSVLLFLLLAPLHSKTAPDYFGINKPDRKIVLGILALNFVGIAVDETYFVMACCGVALFYRIFWPAQWSKVELKKSVTSIAIYFSPFFAFALFVIALPYILYVIPHTKDLFVSHQYEFYFDSLHSSANNSLKFDLNLLRYIWEAIPANIATNYNPTIFLTHLAQSGIGQPQFWRDHFNGILIFFDIILALLFMASLLSFKRGAGHFPVFVNTALTKDRLLWGLPAAFIIYFIVATIVQQFHPGSKFPYGWFYGSLISILLPIVSVALMLRWKMVPTFFGKIVLIVLMLISVSNGLMDTLSYKVGHAQYVYDLMRGEHPQDTYPINPEKIFSNTQFYFSREVNNYLWSPSQERAVKKALYSVWSLRRDGGQIDFAKVDPWNMNEYWFLEEMYLLQSP